MLTNINSVRDNDNGVEDYDDDDNDDDTCFYPFWPGVKDTCRYEG